MKLSIYAFAVCGFLISFAHAEPQVLSDKWYTVTVGKDGRYSFYNDKVEIKDGKLFYQNKVWKSEEGFINEEQLSALAENNQDLDPLFFNFHQTYRDSELIINGNIRDKKNLTVTIRKNGQDLKPIQKSIPSKTFLEIFFPIWLGRHLSQIKPDRMISFSTLLEDSPDQGFSPVGGSLRIEKADALAKKTSTTKLSVTYRDIKSSWYVNQQGFPIRIEMPTQKTIIQEVSKKEAESFLKETKSH